MLFKRKSKIQGKGIFTNELIKKGKIIHLISCKKIFFVPIKHWAKIGKNKFVSDNVLNFVNHSCNPNTKLDVKKLKLITLKQVEPFQEITVNYEKTEKRKNKIKCNCGSKKCKGYFYRGE